ncbi:MAG TPA: lantibiotic dehydratase [Pseudonocardiaceae bacterium]
MTMSAPAVTAAKTWSLGEHFAVRVAGLPIETVHKLRTPRTAAWAESIIDAEQRLREVGTIIGDQLHETISSTQDERVRRRLINVRRQIHQGKALAKDEILAEFTDVLGADAIASLDEWLTARACLAELLTNGAKLADAELAESRANLQNLAGDDRLRLGLHLASPSLDGYVDGYANAGANLSKRHRRIEKSLLEYLYRMACKTSPFSTFTSIGVGRFCDEAPIGTTPIGSGYESFTRVNVSVLSRIAELILDDDELRVDLPVALTSGWQFDVDRVRYVRRTVTTADTGATVSFDSVKDNLFILRSSQILTRVFAVFGEQQHIPWRELTERLSASGGGEPKEYDEYIRVLFRLGLLQVPRLLVDIHEPDPLRAFAGSLKLLGPQFASLFGNTMDEIANRYDAYAIATPAERRELSTSIRSGFEEIMFTLGAPPESLPVTLVFEDTRVDGPAIEVNRGPWEGQFDDSLRQWEKLSPAFDITLPHRLILKGFFTSRFGRGGRCDDLVKLVHDFNEDIFEQYITVSSLRRTFEEDGTYVPFFNWLQLSEIDALDRARMSFAQRLKDNWRANPDAEELVLDDEFVDGIGEELDPVREDITALSHFMQLFGTAEKPQAVLNRTYGGMLFPFSRFTHCYDQPTIAGLRKSMRARVPEGAVLAELTGGHATTNLNLHSRIVDNEIVCPGETSALPRDHQILLEDLYVEHDEPADRLVLRHKVTEREIVPTYLGYLVPSALPEVPRTLLLLSSSASMLFDPWGGVLPDGEQDILVRPRLRLGNLILARRSWSMKGVSLPKKETGTSNEVRFLDWQRWRRELGLPSAVFATVHNPSTETENAGDYGLSRLAKPQYVDFTSQLSLILLDSEIKSDESKIVFQEMLPTEDELPAESDAGHHVIEMAVETTQSMRGFVN